MIIIRVTMTFTDPAGRERLTGLLDAARTATLHEPGSVEPIDLTPVIGTGPTPAAPQ